MTPNTLTLEERKRLGELADKADQEDFDGLELEVAGVIIRAPMASRASKEFMVEAQPTTIKALLNTLDAVEQERDGWKRDFTSLGNNLNDEADALLARASTAEEEVGRLRVELQWAHPSADALAHAVAHFPAPHGALQAEGSDVNCGPMAAETARPSLVADSCRPESLRSPVATKEGQ